MSAERMAQKDGGSKRPPGKDPDQWAYSLAFSKKEKHEAEAQYEENHG